MPQPPRASRTRRGSGRRSNRVWTTFVVLGLLSTLVASANGATTVRAFVAAKNAVAQGPGHTATPVTLVTHGLLVVTGAIAGDRRAGTGLAGSNGVAGTTRTLPTCAVGTCNDSYRGAGTARLVVGHYAEWLQVALAQPPATGTPFGFTFQLSVQLSTGWLFAVGYFSSGTTSAATAQGIHLNLVLDLGTATAPTVLSFRFVPFGCGSTARCP